MSEPSCEPPDWPLVVTNYDLVHARHEGLPPFEFPPDWPPSGFENDAKPRNDSADAIQQWFDLFLHPVWGQLGIFEAAEKNQPPPEPHDYVWIVRDAWRLARHLEGKGRMTRNEIRDLFGRNYPAERIAQSVSLLMRFGPARSRREATGGRPAERWFAENSSTRKGGKTR